MAHSDPFDTSTPAGTDDPRDGDDRIREVKAAIRERLLLGGMWIEDSATPDDEAGRISLGVQATNKLYLYESDRSTSWFEADDSTAGSAAAPKVLKIGDGTTYTLPNIWDLEIGQVSCKTVTFDTCTSTGLATLDSMTGTVKDCDIEAGYSDRVATETHDNGTVALLSSDTGKALITTSQFVTSLGVGNADTNRNFLALFTGTCISDNTNNPIIDLNFQYRKNAGNWTPFSRFFNGITINGSDQGATDITKFALLTLSTSNDDLTIRVTGDGSVANCTWHDISLTAFEIISTVP